MDPSEPPASPRTLTLATYFIAAYGGMVAIGILLDTQTWGSGAAIWSGFIRAGVAALIVGGLALGSRWAWWFGVVALTFLLLTGTSAIVFMALTRGSVGAVTPRAVLGWVALLLLLPSLVLLARRTTREALGM
jgi:hypothetical protein